jgi:hypothetical protein
MRLVLPEDSLGYPRHRCYKMIRPTCIDLHGFAWKPIRNCGERVRFVHDDDHLPTIVVSVQEFPDF